MTDPREVQAALDTLSEFAVVMAKALATLNERVAALEDGRGSLGDSGPSGHGSGVVETARSGQTERAGT